MQLSEEKIFNQGLFGKIEKFSFLRDLFLTVLGIFLIGLGAKIGISLQPVPITLCSFAVLFIAMMYGFRLGMFTILIYVGITIIGLPFFSMTNLKGGAGYLLGYVFASALTGFLAEQGWASHIFSTLIAALLGTLLILLCGWIVLSQSLGALVAFNVGIKPFFLGGALKIILLALIVPAFWKLSQK